MMIKLLLGMNSALIYLYLNEILDAETLPEISHFTFTAVFSCSLAEVRFVLILQGGHDMKTRKLK